MRKVHDDLPEYINQDFLDQDSLLTIDSDYDPEWHIDLKFEEFTRAVCNYKSKIVNKLARNLLISGKDKSKNFAYYYNTIMNMDNRKNRKSTLKAFEEILQEIP